MSGQVLDHPLQAFHASWGVRWRGQRRLAMLTASLEDPSHFVAYGSDGFVAFRVEGAWCGDLGAFLARMDVDAVEILSPPSTALALSRTPPTFPDPLTVQRCFDARLGKAVA